MKKQFLAALFAMLALFVLSTAVFATEETAFIIDHLGRLEEADVTELNTTARHLEKTYGIGIYIAYVEGAAQDTDPQDLVGEARDYVLLVLGERGSSIHTAGKADEIFSDPDDRDRLCYVHDEQDEWSDGVARYLEVSEEYLEKAVPPSSSTAPTSTSEKAKDKNHGFSPLPLIAAAICAAAAIGIALSRKKK